LHTLILPRRIETCENKYNANYTTDKASEQLGNESCQAFVEIEMIFEKLHQFSELFVLTYGSLINLSGIWVLFRR
jgi:hypothetical protein